MQCQHCGSIIAYADDSTFTITDSDPAQLTEKLTQKFEIMVDYLTANIYDTFMGRMFRVLT